MGSSFFSDKKGSDGCEGSNKKWYEEITAEDGDLIPKIILRYEESVYALALCLVSEPKLAQQVVEEVFRRVEDEIGALYGLCLDTAIHRFTYDSALTLLLQRIDSHAEEIFELGSEYTGCSPAAMLRH